MLEHALKYLELGLSVIPIHYSINNGCSCGSPTCQSPGKHPMVNWKIYTKKRSTIQQIKSWWKKHPGSNVGFVTGEISGITVIDVDGEEGLRSLELIGTPLRSLPISPSVKTGGGGFHIYFKYSKAHGLKTKSGIIKKVDIRSDNGVVVAPPSMHVSGNAYEWIKGQSIFDIPIVDHDLAFLVQVNKKGTVTGLTKGLPDKTVDKWYEAYLEGVGEGSRNDAATKLAGRYARSGMSIKEVTMMLSAWNKNNTPPMSEQELEGVIKSISTREDVSEEENGCQRHLSKISVILSMQLNRVKRITGDDPQIMMEFEEGTCTVTTAQLLSPKLFQQAIAEATKVIVKKLSSKGMPNHEGLVQMIMDAAEEVDAGVEATWTGEVTMLLKDFIISQGIVPSINKGEEIPDYGCFRTGNILWVNLIDLVQRGGARWGIKPSIKQMAQRLKVLGVERGSFRSENKTVKNMWGVNPARLGLFSGESQDE